MQNLKKNMIIARVTGTVMGALLGALVLVLAAILKPETVSAIIHWTLVICGVFTVISNVPGVISGIGNLNTTDGMVDFISAMLGILLGFALVLFQNTVLVVIIGAYLILFPLLRVLMAADKGQQLRREVWRMAMGVLLLVFLPLLFDAASRIVHILLVVVGWAVIAFSLVIGVVGIVRIVRAPKDNRTRKQASGGKKSGTVYADTTGDGKIDTIYMDTDRDGKPDTTIHMDN